MIAVTPFGFQPFEQPPQLGAQHGLVVEAAEQRFDGVDDDALSPDGIDGEPDPDEQAFEIVVAGFFDLVTVDVDMVDRDALLFDQPSDVVAQRTDIRDQILGLLLECDEHAWLVELNGAVIEESHREQRLAAAGRAAQQGWTPLGQATEGDFIQTVDPGRSFLNHGKIPRHDLRTHTGLHCSPA